MLDLTEETFNHISINDYKTISSLSQNVFNGEVVRIQPITENGFNSIESYKIQSVNSPLFGNEFLRRNEIKNTILQLIQRFIC